MIANPLKIFNPFDLPFGPLSINYVDTIKINKKSYKSVAHYIYTSLVNTPYFKEIINNQTSIGDMKKTAVELIEKERKAIIANALDKAYIVQSNYVDFMDNLYLTGNRPLIYIAENDVTGEISDLGYMLGVDKKGKGENMIGHKLMALRDILYFKAIEIQKLKGEQDLFDKVYPIYLVAKYMENLIQFGKSNLEEFVGQSALFMYSNFDQSTIDKLVAENMDFSTVVEAFKKGNLDYIVIELKNPGFLADYYRSEYLGQYYRVLRQKEKNIVIDMYTYYIAKKTFGESIQIGEKEISLDELNIRERRDQEIKKLSYKQKVKLQTKIYKLYLKKRLPNIDEINTFIIEELGQINFNMKLVEKLKKKVKEIKKISENIPLEINYPQLPTVQYDTTPFYFSDDLYIGKTDDWISPANTKYPFVVDGLFYPSICHYVNAVLLTTVPGVSMFDAHLSLFIDKNRSKKIRQQKEDIKKSLKELEERIKQSRNNLANVYEELLDRNEIIEVQQKEEIKLREEWRENLPKPIKTDNVDYYIDCAVLSTMTFKLLNESYDQRITESSNLGNLAKFKNNELGQLLVATGDVKIIYNDIYDMLLGSGENDTGKNVVGEQLMKIRSDLIAAGVAPKVKEIKQIEYAEDLTLDPRIKEWYNTRLFDSIRSLNKWETYIKSKYDKKLSTIAMDYLLNTVYTNCQDIGKRNFINSQNVPDTFIQELDRYTLPSLPKNGTIILWNYMRGLLLYLEAISVRNRSGFYKNLKRAQDSLSSIDRIPCKQLIPMKDGKDFMLNAVLNSILSILISLQKYSKYGDYMASTYTLEMSDVTCIKGLLNVDVPDDIPSILESNPNVAIDSRTFEFLKRESEVFGYIYSYLEKIGIEVEEKKVLRHLIMYAIIVSNNLKLRTENRLSFFINVDEIKDVPMVEKEFKYKKTVVVDEEEASSQEYEEETDEDEEEVEKGDEEEEKDEDYGEGEGEYEEEGRGEEYED
jgi:predicted NAD-dependent protein-ADP-ribosyltransferase YbiA (DUF1768 family)